MPGPEDAVDASYVGGAEGPCLYVAIAAPQSGPEQLEPFVSSDGGRLVVPFAQLNSAIRQAKATEGCNLALHVWTAQASMPPLQAAEYKPEIALASGRITVKSSERTVQADGEYVSLTPIQFGILEYLAQHLNAIRSRREITRDVLGREMKRGNREVDGFVKKIRQKLGPELGHVESGAIFTKPGEGYAALEELGTKL